MNTKHFSLLDQNKGLCRYMCLIPKEFLYHAEFKFFRWYSVLRYKKSIIPSTHHSINYNTIKNHVDQLKYLRFHFTGYSKSVKMAANQGQEVVGCDLCQNLVSFSCRRCGVNLCDPCVPVHLRVSSQNGHDVVDFTKKDDDMCFCESHQQHACSAFCKTCNIPICILCVSIEHKSHNLSELSVKIEEVLKSIAHENDRLQSFRHELETHLDHTTKQLSLLSSFYQKKNEDVTSRGNDWHKQIDKSKKKLQQKLDNLKKKNEDVLWKEKRELKELIEMIDEMNWETTRFQKSKNLTKMIEFSRIIKGLNKKKYTPPKFHQFKTDENSLQTNFGCIKEMQDIKVSLLGKNFIPDNDSREKILEILYVSSVIDSQAQIQNFFKGEGLIKRFLKKSMFFLFFLWLCYDVPKNLLFLFFFLILLFLDRFL